MNIMVILNYNDYFMTQKYLEMIQNYNVLDKIVVVDNNSTDDSYKILKSYANDKIDVIKCDENGGYANGNNYGIHYIESKYTPYNIIISNPDIIVSEKSIINICEFLKCNERVGIASGLIYDINNNVASNFAWKQPTYCDVLIGCFLLSSKFFDCVFHKFHYHKYLTKKYLNVDVISGCFFAVKYDVLKEVDYFDDRTFLYNEENILGYKIKELGYREVVLIQEKIIHFAGSSVKKNLSQWKKKAEILKDSRCVYLKYHLKVSKFKLIIYKILFGMGKYERHYMAKIKNIFTK